MESKSFLSHRLQQIGIQYCRLLKCLEFSTLRQRLDQQCILRRHCRGKGAVVGWMDGREYRNIAEPENCNSNSKSSQRMQPITKHSNTSLSTNTNPPGLAFVTVARKERKIGSAAFAFPILLPHFKFISKNSLDFCLEERCEVRLLYSFGVRLR